MPDHAIIYAKRTGATEYTYVRVCVCVCASMYRRIFRNLLFKYFYSTSNMDNTQIIFIIVLTIPRKLGALALPCFAALPIPLYTHTCICGIYTTDADLKLARVKMLNNRRRENNTSRTMLWDRFDLWDFSWASAPRLIYSI